MFERVGNGVYCPGPHYRPCSVCGKPVEYHKPSEPIKTCSPECKKILSNQKRQRTRICDICGKEFTANAPNQKYCKGPHITACEVCGMDIEYTCDPADKPRTCSKECATSLKVQTVESRYGVKNVSELTSVRSKISESKTDKVGYFMRKAQDKKSPTPTERVCKACGKTFLGYGTTEYCPDKHYKKCVVCGNDFEWNHKQPKNTCSTECKMRLRAQTIASKTRKCALCGKEFTPNNSSQIYCSDIHYAPCPVCGKPTELSNLMEAKCCSTDCQVKHREQTCLERYGVSVASQADLARQKLHDAAINPDVQIKRISSNLKRWGYDNPSKNPEVRKRIAKSVRSIVCQAQTRSTSLKRYGVVHPMQSAEIVKRYSETCEAKYDVPYFCLTDKCRNASGMIISAVNRRFGDILKGHGIRYKHEFRIDTKSYDFLIQDSNILVEINPTYTHNSYGNHWNDGLPKMYHREKTRLATEHGYTCINIWDWDDVEKIAGILSLKKPIYARKCYVDVIDRRTAEIFELQYHLQGAVRGQEICLGLFYNEELVQIMTFGKPRYNKKYEYELLRLCSNKEYAVTGGAGKLWKYFIRHYDPASVISYCDISKFSGKVYTDIGMQLDGVTEPNKIWSKGSDMITNNLLLQRGYDQLFGTDYGAGTSNEQLMIESGWLPVYDCGQYRFTYHKPDICAK